MRAIAFESYGGPAVLRLREFPDPKPGLDQVLIRTRAAGIGPGDCKTRRGSLQQHFTLQFPKITGRDGTGLVECVGDNIKRFAPGDRVAFLTGLALQGSCAELTTAPEHLIATIPPQLSYVEAAALAQPGCCALTAIMEAGRLQRGERILVHGATGAIGTLVVQLARHIGAHVTATCRAAHIELVRGLGADVVIALDRGDPLPEARSLDLVFDPIGGAVHRACYPLLKPGGRLVYLIAEPIEDLSADYGVATIRAPIRDRGEVLQRVMDLAAQSIWRALIARTLPFEACAQAHQILEQGVKGPGRIVLEFPA
jgi:NADPH:quinone reductase-like Zn-dependent oxidoreductase